MEYTVGNMVHVIAEPQTGKNQCNWLATKVRYEIFPSKAMRNVFHFEVRHVKASSQPSPDNSFLMPGSSTSQAVPRYSEFPAFNKSVTVDAKHVSDVIVSFFFI